MLSIRGATVPSALSAKTPTLEDRSVGQLKRPREEPLSGLGEDGDSPEQKRSRNSPGDLTSPHGISLGQIRFSSHDMQANGGEGGTILASISSSNQYNALGSEIRVAAKKLRCHDTTMDGDTFSKALASELNLLVDLSHPNIGKLTGFEQDLQNGIVWMFSTWEANGNLSEFLATRQWNIPERLSLIKDIIAGLKYLHTYQPPICHGNFKSRNVLVNSASRAVVTDFLSARILRRVSKVAERQVYGQAMVLQQFKFPAEGPSSPQLSISYCGTRLSLVALGEYVRWEAPEVHFGMQPDFPCDIWAAGWICCEIITNKIPLSGNDSSALETFERNLPEIRGAAEREQVSNLCGLVEACLALDPLKRPTIEWCETEVKGMASVVPASGTLSGDKIRSPKLLCELGRTHYQLGNKEAALPLFTEALAIARIVGDNSLVAEAMVSVGNIQRDLASMPPPRSPFQQPERFMFAMTTSWVKRVYYLVSGKSVVFKPSTSRQRASSSLHSTSTLASTMIWA